jgi:hypothetical protein
MDFIVIENWCGRQQNKMDKIRDTEEEENNR